MKIARFNGGRIGLVEGDEIADLTEAEGIDPASWPPVGMVRFIARHAARPADIARLAEGAPRLRLGDVRLDCPIDWPNKVVAMPANYTAHIEEQKTSKVGLISAFPASAQGFFVKANSSLSGPADPIVLPPLDGREIHHECELAIIIGKGGRSIPRAEALDHVFGYACLIDVVVRGKEERVMRKSYDTFCPLGPTIVTADEIADPFDIDLELTVNGEVRQQANTRDMLVDIPAMIEMASAVMTLYPGDVFASGTPAGVGPIRAGDVVVSSAAGVGRLTLDVVRGENGAHPVWNKAA
ncbi:fumarylacetoacetate hydrolase family protein [Acuticoccus mangrovi]|uniref:Fumarylacetoacetate hydrolase family protein n=1 Tax=Acuticoccus mangrovi TaxID=2796142 RepID=A0A934MFV9_9HYPH|nr:fumarylacetoacetate hydrolase family protein [Acuticoccus mangrovi]MBJ3775345.1 fumarylacetoacetate hydrolase family protein [Acuticoccus mangrovi]